jgi:hypothetical protein
VSKPRVARARWSAALVMLGSGLLACACSPAEPTLVVVNRTLVPVVFGFAPIVPPCATAEYAWSELTTPGDVPVPPDAWFAPTQIAAPPGTVVTVIVTDGGVDVREGRVVDAELPPCRGRPPDG